MKAYKKIILLGLLAWLCLCVAESIYFGWVFAGPLFLFALPGAPFEKYFPNAEVAGDILFFGILVGLAIFAWIKRSAPVAVVFCSLLLGSSVFGWFYFRAVTADVDVDVAQSVGKAVKVEMKCIDFWDHNERWPSNYDELVKFIGESNIGTLGPTDHVWFRKSENGGLSIDSFIGGQSNAMSLGRPSIQHLSQTETNSSQ